MTRSDVKNLKRRAIFRRILTCLLLAVLVWVFYIAAGRALCFIAMRQIGGLTNTRIRTESVAFHSNGSVYIKNLTISPYEQQADDVAILSAENVYARFKLSSLLVLKPRLKVIDVNDFVFNARYNMDAGRWNVSALKFRPLRHDPDGMPAIQLGRGTLQYSKISRGREKVALRVPLNARFGFDDRMQEGYSFEITTATMASGFGRSRLTGHWKPGVLTIAGGISSVDIPELEMAWLIDVLAAELTYDQNHAFGLKLNIRDLQSRRSPELERLPLVGPAFLGPSGPFAALQNFFEYYQPRGRIDIELDASGNLNRLADSTLAGTVYCKDVALCHCEFQYPIEHLAGRVDFTDHSVKLNNLSGRHAEVELFFNGSSSDFGPDWKYDVRITSDPMPLDTDLYEALGARQQEFWRAFSPTGSVAVDYQLSRTSPTDRHRKLLVELRGTDAMYQNFPYPLKNLTGKLAFEGGKVLFSNVVSQADEQQIIINGETAIRPGSESMYDVSVQVDSLPLDSTLEAALPEKQKSLYRQLGPSGLADGWVKFSKKDASPSGFTADLSFREASLNSDKLPFQVSGITARAQFTPDSMTINGFSGRYDDGLVSLAGQVRPNTEDGQLTYDLVLGFRRAWLDGELLGLLPESLRKIVSDLEPEGRVNVIADLSKLNLAESPDYSIALECLGNSVILPKRCYFLKDIHGGLTIEPDRITFVDINAVVHEDAPADQTKATMNLSGELALTDDGVGDGTLDLVVHDAPLDEQFALALPQHLQVVYDKLAPNGRFDLDFEDIHISRTNDGEKSVDFSGGVTLKNCGFAMSGSRMATNAELTTEGRYTTGQGLVDCQTVLDDGTLTIQGKSFTGLKANIFYDPNVRECSTENLTADWYGGRLRGKFVLRQPAGQPAEYMLQAGFDGVDLQRFLTDADSDAPRGNGHTSGRMNGSFGVNARIGDNASRIGACKLTISDMQVGKLSPLAKVLNVLKLTEPTDYAFDQMFMDSYIKQNSLLVRKLDLSGRSVAFYGSGQMDLQTQDVDLSLTARGRRLATDDPSVLQSLTEGLGQAVVRMNVTGSFHDPKVTTQPLPVIEGTLQVLGAKPAGSN